MVVMRNHWFNDKGEGDAMQETIFAANWSSQF